MIISGQWNFYGHQSKSSTMSTKIEIISQEAIFLMNSIYRYDLFQTPPAPYIDSWVVEFCWILYISISYKFILLHISKETGIQLLVI